MRLGKAEIGQAVVMASSDFEEIVKRLLRVLLLWIVLVLGCCADLAWCLVISQTEGRPPAFCWLCCALKKCREGFECGRLKHQWSSCEPFLHGRAKPASTERKLAVRRTLQFLFVGNLGAAGQNAYW